jgi:hypothetical protein
VRQQRAGGMTVRDYCALHQLAESSFHFWRREIAARDSEHQQRDEAKAEAAFVPVTLVESSSDADAGIEIELRTGQRLRVRRGCDRQLLSEVVAVLEGRPC